MSSECSWLHTATYDKEFIHGTPSTQACLTLPRISGTTQLMPGVYPPEADETTVQFDGSVGLDHPRGLTVRTFGEEGYGIGTC